MSELNTVRITLADYLALRDEITGLKNRLNECEEKSDSIVLEYNAMEKTLVKLSVANFLTEYPKSSYKHFDEDGTFTAEHSWVERDLSALIAEYKIDRVNFINELRKQVKGEDENE